MSCGDNTRLRLEAALQRILVGKPVRIPDHRKLSVRAVEEEANLGNGSSYYYPEIVDKIKTAKAATKAKKSGKKSISDLETARQAKNTATRLKEQYRDEAQALRAELGTMATIHHQLSFALRKANKTIDEIKRELDETKQQLIEARRNSVTALK